MFEIIELLLTILFEGLLPTLLEGFVEFGLEEVFEMKHRYSWVATIGYFMIGFLVGGLTIFFFPSAFVHRPFIPGASLLLSPLVGGITMAGFDSLVHKHESRPYIKFIHGAAFSFPIALVRFALAQ